MNPIPMLRQQFLRGLGGTLGLAALSKLSEPSALATPVATENAPPSPFQHHAPKAKRIIYLFQSGAPSQMDLFDWKPALAERRGEDLPDSIRQGQRLTTMTSTSGGGGMPPGALAEPGASPP